LISFKFTKVLHFANRRLIHSKRKKVVLLAWGGGGVVVPYWDSTAAAGGVGAAVAGGDEHWALCASRKASATKSRGDHNVRGPGGAFREATM
jgi:hypothetical protein